MVETVHDVVGRRFASLGGGLDQTMTGNVPAMGQVQDLSS